MAVINWNLNSIVQKIGKTLVGNADIKKFCTTNFSKALLTICGDVRPEDCPSSEDAPYIIIYDARKKEGDSDSQVHDSVNIGFEIPVKSELITEDGITYQKGYKLVCDFQELIQDVINSMRQIDYVDVEIFKPVEADGSGWAGNMSVRWDIDQVISLGEEQEF
jgi:hypothetical protein